MIPGFEPIVNNANRASMSLANFLCTSFAYRYNQISAPHHEFLELEIQNPPHSTRVIIPPRRNRVPKVKDKWTRKTSRVPASQEERTQWASTSDHHIRNPTEWQIDVSSHESPYEKLIWHD